VADGVAERAEGRSFGASLQRALRLLRAEAPVHFAATRERLGPRAVDITVGDEAPVRVHLDGGEPWVVAAAEGAGPAAEVNIGVSRADLSAFLRGELTIEDGVAHGRLSVRGSLDHVLAFLDALSAWLHGALRSPGFPALHRSYLGTLTANE
jgi:hypothetical protein